MRKKEFTLTLDNPCEQEWDKMPAVNDGLFCKDCSKVVRDFTSMSDEELIRIFTEPGMSNTCGKFHKSQLNKVYVVEQPKQRRSHAALKMLLASILALEFPLQAQMQVGSQKNPIQHQGQRKKIINAADTITSIKGSVKNKTTGEGIRISIILYYGMDINSFERFSETLSDADGSYEIQLPDSGLHKFFKLVFSNENYTERIVVVDKERIPQFLPVRLVPLIFVEVTTTLPQHVDGQVYQTAGVPVREYSEGGIAMETIVSRPSNFRQRLKGFFRRIFR